jgi:flagellar biosynthesis chaperone FliJ
MRHYAHLKTTRAQQSVYAQSSEAAIVTASIHEVIATLDEQIAQVERKIRQRRSTIAHWGRLGNSATRPT